MVLDIAGGLFGQEDVRETPAVTNQFSFNTTDFTDSSGAISLRNKTSYASISSHTFQAQNPDSDDCSYGTATGDLTSDAANLNFFGCIQLPHGAIITGAIVYSDHGTWKLKRSNSAGQDDTLASGNFNTEDTTINNATVNNQTYSYYFEALDLDIGDVLAGARVKYTTDYD